MLAETPAELMVLTHAALAFVLAWTIGYERFYTAARQELRCIAWSARRVAH